MIRTYPYLTVVELFTPCNRSRIHHNVKKKKNNNNTTWSYHSVATRYVCSGSVFPKLTKPPIFSIIKATSIRSFPLFIFPPHTQTSPLYYTQPPPPRGNPPTNIPTPNPPTLILYARMGIFGTSTGLGGFANLCCVGQGAWRWMGMAWWWAKTHHVCAISFIPGVIISTHQPTEISIR